jgi:hypothetical protein
MSNNQITALHPNAIKPTNDDWMVKNNNRLPLIKLDKSIFVKTKEEKIQLQKIKNISNKITNNQLRDECLSIILNQKTLNCDSLTLTLIK